MRRKKKSTGGVVLRGVIDGWAGIMGGHRRAAELTWNCLNKGFSRTFVIHSLLLALGIVERRMEER